MKDFQKRMIDIKKYMKKGVSIRKVAEKIAADHLEESPDYYKQLAKIEGKFEKAKKNNKMFGGKRNK